MFWSLSNLSQLRLKLLDPLLKPRIYQKKKLGKEDISIIYCDKFEDVKEEPEDEVDIHLFNCLLYEYKGHVRYYLKNHITRCHKCMLETNMNFLCTVGNSQHLGLTDLHKHCLEKHKDKLPKVTCNICYKEFASTKTLLFHKRTTHDEYKISCTDCGKEVTSKQGLLHHKQKVHSIKTSTDSCHDLNVQKKEIISTNEDHYQCEFGITKCDCDNGLEKLEKENLKIQK